MTAVFIQMETHYILGRCKNTVVANTQLCTTTRTLYYTCRRYATHSRRRYANVCMRIDCSCNHNSPRSFLLHDVQCSGGSTPPAMVPLRSCLHVVSVRPQRLEQLASVAFSNKLVATLCVYEPSTSSSSRAFCMRSQILLQQGRVFYVAREPQTRPFAMRWHARAITKMIYQNILDTVITLHRPYARRRLYTIYTVCQALCTDSLSR